MHAATASALIVLAAALVVDWALGEYPSPLHPVVWIGNAINAGMRLAPPQGRWRQLLFGAILAFGICTLSAAITFLILRWAAAWPIVELIAGTFFLKASFALWELKRAADRVVQPLQHGDLAQAREALRSLCSRDPSCLDESALLAAVLSSLAENLCDSFIAPLCYWTVFGVPGAMGYRAVNTLDATIGYRGRYEFLGKMAARLDDVVNWLPARLTAGLLLLAGCLTGKNVITAWRILRRDGAKTPSPNGGRPMAVMAGLLGVELEKKGVYVLGDAREPLRPKKVRQAWLLVRIAAVVMVVLCGLAASALASAPVASPKTCVRVSPTLAPGAISHWQTAQRRLRTRRPQHPRDCVLSHLRRAARWSLSAGRTASPGTVGGPRRGGPAFRARIDLSSYRISDAAALGLWPTQLTEHFDADSRSGQEFRHPCRAGNTIHQFQDAIRPFVHKQGRHPNNGCAMLGNLPLELIRIGPSGSGCG